MFEINKISLLKKHSVIFREQYFRVVAQYLFRVSLEDSTPLAEHCKRQCVIASERSSHSSVALQLTLFYRTKKRPEHMFFQLKKQSCHSSHNTWKTATITLLHATSSSLIGCPGMSWLFSPARRIFFFSSSCPAICRLPLAPSLPRVFFRGTGNTPCYIFDKAKQHSLQRLNGSQQNSGPTAKRHPQRQTLS